MLLCPLWDNVFLKKKKNQVWLSNHDSHNSALETRCVPVANKPGAAVLFFSPSPFTSVDAAVERWGPCHSAMRKVQLPAHICAQAFSTCAAFHVYCTLIMLDRNSNICMEAKTRRDDFSSCLSLHGWNSPNWNVWFDCFYSLFFKNFFPV